MAALNIKGKIFNYWTVIESAGVKDYISYWKCKCQCGKIKILSLGNLRSGQSKSCGCNKEHYTRPKIGDKYNNWKIISDSISVKTKNGTLIKYICECACGTIKKVGLRNILIGDSKSCGCLVKTNSYSKCPEFRVWQALRDRCNNPNSQAYKNYGGRGIKVCERWNESYKNFIQDMGSRPTDMHTLDRINNEGNYEPTNCRWATYSEQLNNTRNTTKILFKGKTMSVSEICKDIKLPRGTVYDWYRKGIIDEKLLSYQ